MSYPTAQYFGQRIAKDQDVVQLDGITVPVRCVQCGRMVDPSEPMVQYEDGEVCGRCDDIAMGAAFGTAEPQQ